MHLRCKNKLPDSTECVNYFRDPALLGSNQRERCVVRRGTKCVRACRPSTAQAEL
jgi:hypothetical protein